MLTLYIANKNYSSWSLRPWVLMPELGILLDDWGTHCRALERRPDAVRRPIPGREPFTAVDAFFAPVAFRAQTYSPPLPDDSQRYVQRVLELPSMRQWYSDALDEPWREQHHEAEACSAGIWLADLRSTARQHAPAKGLR